MEFRHAGVNGKATYELAEEAKHNLELCLECCAAELDTFEVNRNQLAPAPFFFERATLLLKKQKRWRELENIALQYLVALDLYKNTTPPNAAKVWLSPKVEKIRQRLAQAQSFL